MHLPTRLLALSLLIYLLAVPSGAVPSFPKLRDIASSFQTNVELTNKIQEGTTAIAKEYYDFEDQTGRLDVRAVGDKISYFIYGKTDQVFTVTDTTCIENEGGVFELDLFYNWSNAAPMYAGPSALFLKAENLSPRYIDSKRVRGIQCNHFQSSSSKSDESKEFTVDYYFSDPGWTMPFKSSEFGYPVRIEIYYMAKDNQVDQTIDFLYFRPNFKDKAKFQIPVGLGCYGKDIREKEVKLPTIPKQFTFSVESFDFLHDETSADTDVPMYRVWYDSRLKVGRLDTYNNKGLTSDLYDFKTGVQYHMHDYRTCRTITMRKNSIFLTFDPDTLVGRMKQPKEFLYLENDFYTIGEADVRGLKAQVFEKAEMNVTLGGTFYSLLVTTVYFTTETTKIQVDGEDIDTSPPIDIRITGYVPNNKVAFKRQYQIFSFDDEPGREFFSTFPIMTCFPGVKQKAFFIIQVAATLEIAAKIEEKSPVFYESAKSKIINVANITELRLPFMKVDYSPSGIFITGFMLDKPPVLTQFWREFDQPVMTEETAAYVISIDADDEESCATECVELKPVKCKGFHFCGKACFLNTGEIIDEPVDNVPIGAECYVYIRSVLDSENDKASLEKALKNLVDAKDKGTLQFEAVAGKDQDLLGAVQVLTTFSTRGESINDYPYMLVHDGSEIKGEGDVKSTTEYPNIESEQDCYRLCKGATTTACASFSYCPKTSTQICRISSVLLGGPEDSKEISTNPNCAVYNMLYLDFFDPYPGKSFPFNGDKVQEGVETVEQCAKYCKEENGFTCRGFEYCKSTKDCELHSKHVLDIKEGNMVASKSQCVHYAAKYIADYRDLGYQLIDDESNVRGEITLEECAKACSEEISGCSSFNYCPPSSVGMADSTCSFTSMTLYDRVRTKTKEKCHLYSKRDNVDDWLPRRAKPKTDGFTSGGFAGLLIGMIVLGLVIGAILFVAYSYYRSRSGGGDGLTVKFSKHENI